MPEVQEETERPSGTLRKEDSLYGMRNGPGNQPTIIDQIGFRQFCISPTPDATHTDCTNPEHSNPEDSNAEFKTGSGATIRFAARGPQGTGCAERTCLKFILGSI